MSEQRTANFWEALQSAAANLGEVWVRECMQRDIQVYLGISDFWRTHKALRFVSGEKTLHDGHGGVFLVDVDDLAATWVCEEQP